MTFNEKLEYYGNITEEALNSFLPEDNNCPEIIKKAVAYSLLGGGKRIRPAICLAFYEMLGGNPTDVLPFACALEMIHTYSLIHDDLPCMDDDDMRRGKPSNHIVFGEVNALLAGDGLLTLAFETASKANPEIIPYDRTVRCINVLANAAGICGMVGGQILDLEAENKEITLDELKTLQYKKTGMMIIAAAQLGCIAAGANSKVIENATIYAENIGRVFQMIDDILDVTSDVETLGKPINSDSENNKNTFVTFYGIDKTFEISSQLTEESKIALKNIDADSTFLCELSDKLLYRKK